MQARTTHGCAIGPVIRLTVVLAALGLFGCNAPDYVGIPIEQFMQIAEEENAAARPTTRPAVTTRPTATPSDYRVGPSDVLSLTIYGLDSLETPTIVPARVTDDGRIALPLVGGLLVQDQSLTQVERVVAAAYAPKYIRNPRVLADVKEYHLTNVLVITAMAGAREVGLRRNERTIFQSLAKAQGGAGTSPQQIYVQPASDANSLELYDMGVAGEMLRVMGRGPLQEGDIVISRPAPVPMVYISGLTGGAGGSFAGSRGGVYGGGGALPIPETGLRLRQALAAAGGLPTAFDTDKIALTRRLRDGRDVCVVFKWKELAVGRQPDVDLRPGDVIDIPHTAQTRTEEILRNAVVLRAGLSAVYDPIAEFVPSNVNVNGYNNNGYSIRKMILSDVALRAVNKVTAPVLGP